MKDKNKTEYNLCIKYPVCKYCPRNKKCEKELIEEAIKRKRGDKGESKHFRNRVRNNKRRRNKR